jgi:hypothetical protein
MNGGQEVLGRSTSGPLDSETKTRGGKRAFGRTGWPAPGRRPIICALRTAAGPFRAVSRLTNRLTSVPSWPEVLKRSVIDPSSGSLRKISPVHVYMTGCPAGWGSLKMKRPFPTYSCPSRACVASLN